MRKLLLIWPRTRDSPIYERLVPTLTIPYLAGLTPDTWHVEFADDNLGEVSLEAQADLVAISVNTMAAPRAYFIADAFRARGIAVVLGGWHVTFRAEEASQHADAVVLGEADDTWVQVLQDFERNTLRARYVSENKSDLSLYPRIRRDLLEARPYFTRNLIQATRGCPYRCSFCSVSTVNPKYRRRPIRDVVGEASSLPGKTLFFVDDNLFIHRAYTRELFAALRPLGKKWIGEASIDLADDPELVDLAAASGLVGLLVGFESIAPASLQEMNKQRTNAVARYGRQIRTLQKKGIGVLGMFTFGTDHDTPEVFERTLAFCDEADLFGASFGILTPFPGTPVFEKLDAAGRILTHDWRLYDLQHLVFRHSLWTGNTLQSAVRRIEERYYSWGAFLRRTLKLWRYPRLWRPANLLLYLVVNFQYVSVIRKRKRLAAVVSGTPLPDARSIPAAR